MESRLFINTCKPQAAVETFELQTANKIIWNDVKQRKPFLNNQKHIWTSKKKFEHPEEILFMQKDILTSK